MKLCLFPDLCNSRFVEVNLDKEARARQERTPKLSSPSKANPFLDPMVCDRFVSELARQREADHTYGGYLEDRRFLWNTSYLDSSASYLHLGVDFNVPEHTKVAALFPGTIVRIDDDCGVESGWGPRIIIAPDQADKQDMPYCIFAHLFAPQVRVGDRTRPGTILATVGNAPNNGNWFPHLHVQMVEPQRYKALLESDLAALDGYGHERDRSAFETDYPNPLKFEWLVGQPFVYD